MRLRSVASLTTERLSLCKSRGCRLISKNFRCIMRIRRRTRLRMTSMFRPLIACSRKTEI